jgi:aminoglycoside 6'-N-acetyltransferase
VALGEGDLTLRGFSDQDRSALLELLAEPEVRRWWPVPDFVPEHGWVIEQDGELAGWLEYHEESYRWYPSVAFDIVLASRLHGRGLGRRALRLAVEHFVAKGHHRFTIDPNAANERAIRCYQAVGFEPVGVMRCYERNPAGGWNDALLMELIVPEAIERDLLAGGEERR